MESFITEYINSIEYGKIQEHKNLWILPLLNKQGEGPRYITLKEALNANSLIIKETDDQGSVPELIAINRGSTPILLLDGEELVGAKQNRVLNTSILLKKGSETLIPVSCTEQGRWSYTSDKFQESEVMMSPKLRMSKASTVAASLAREEMFHSDQSVVWDDVADMADAANIHSDTDAMSDIYMSKKEDLDEYINSFSVVPNQKGVLVYIDGNIVGLDILSRISAYAVLHKKIVKSYAMDAILSRNTSNNDFILADVEKFFDDVTKLDEKKHKSIGHGWDHRFTGKELVGSALVYRNQVIHAAFFTAKTVDDSGHISGFSNRRDYRI